ncbi:helix-turn-helix transcriptional regulator [Mesorhizobium sp. M0340]|uniref:helix-turn-helix domain-containing protein n=1 Tax=Mesorhizobium sp. M0340 TaxID=2956939 RepID=UPI00333D4ACE
MAPNGEVGPHSADRHVGRQIATLRVQSDVSQAQLAHAIRISFQQLQKYESARNRVSAVSRFFDGLPGNGEATAPLLPVDERLEFIASAEGRRLIKRLMRLPQRVRNRVSSLLFELGKEIDPVQSTQEGACNDPFKPSTPTTAFADWAAEVRCLWRGDVVKRHRQVQAHSHPLFGRDRKRDLR